MLDAWIIEEMRRRERERERKRERERPALQLPIPEPNLHRPPRRDPDEEEAERGSRVIIIDIA